MLTSNYGLEMKFCRLGEDVAIKDGCRIEVYASWWLSYVLGGVVSALCAFYLLGCVLAIVTWPFKRKPAA